MNQPDAEKLITATDEVFDHLSTLLEIVNATCEGNSRQRFQRAIGVALTELDREILELIYKQYPNLRPAA